MPGYLTPPIESGNRGYIDTLELMNQAPDNPAQHPVNASIDTIVLVSLLSHGWTLGDTSMVPGTKANSLMTFFSVPFHTGPAGGFSQVPGGGGAALMGTFDTFTFVLWDPFSTMGGPSGHGDVDPTNPIARIVGVPLGTTANMTIENFLSKFGAFTHYHGSPNFDAITGDLISANITAAGDKGDPDPPYGPIFNDPQWSPGGANVAGAAPRGGGWYVLSTAAPNTGDFMRLWIYEDVQGNCAVQVRFNDNPLFDSPSYPIAQKTIHFSCCPYQFTLQARANAITLDGDSFNGNNFYLASCLFVPDEFAAGVKNASFVSGDLAQQFQSKNNTTVFCNGVMKSSWAQTSGDVFGLMFPLLDIGTLATDAESSALKPLIIAPLVSLTIADDSEGYIAGSLWDSYFTLRRYDYEQGAKDKLKPVYIAWIQDEETLHLANATLWMNAQEGTPTS